MMCEETHPDTEKLVQNVFKNIDIDALHSTLVYFYKLSQDPVMVRHQLLVMNTYIHSGMLQKRLEKDDDAERAAFRTYQVLVHMADFEGITLSDVGKELSIILK